MGRIILKTPNQIEKMARSCALLEKIVRKLALRAKIGVSTLELDKIACQLILKNGAKPSFKGYNGYPNTLCASINSQIVHGLPSARKLKNGDILGIDLGLVLNGWHADRAITIPIGKVTSEALKLIKATKTALDVAIKNIAPDVHFGTIGNLIEQVADKSGFYVIRELSGHGIGKKLHESPRFFNFGKKGEGIRFKKGMVIAIEPMFATRGWRIITDRDNWSIKMRDGGIGAHFEHTIAVTGKGARVLTK